MEIFSNRERRNVSADDTHFSHTRKYMANFNLSTATFLFYSSHCNQTVISQKIFTQIDFSTPGVAISSVFEIYAKIMRKKYLFMREFNPSLKD